MTYAIQAGDRKEANALPRDTDQVSCVWEPRPDITAYELAKAIPFLLDQGWLASDLTETALAGLGDAGRHFRRLGAILILLLFAWPVTAQPNAVGGGVFFTPASQGTGNGSGVGVWAGGSYAVWDRYVVLEGAGSLDTADKIYVGNGHNWHARVTANIYAPIECNLCPFAEVGLNWAEQVNTQYSKAITNKIIGGGLNYRNTLLYKVQYLLPEHGTLNQVSAIRTGLDYYRPIAPGWLMTAGGALTRTKFYQPTGPLTGWHSAVGFSGFAGVMWGPGASRNDKREE